jgi:hypothetical protein
MTAPADLADEFSRAGAQAASNGTSSDQTTPRDNTTLTNYERPDIPHPAYERMRPRWEKCRALMGGTEALRAGGETYLPTIPNESTAVHDYRLNLVALFNGFARTVKACAGLINQKEPALSEDMPQRLVDMWENVDRAGTHGAELTKQLTIDGMVDGFGGIFVDYPRLDDPTIDRSNASAAALPGAQLDGADEAALKLGPYFIKVKADDVIKAIYQVVNGVRTLTLLVLRETSDVRVGPFGIETVLRYRVYTDTKGRVEYSLWERLARTQAIPVQKTQPAVITNVKAIPWAPFRAGDIIDQNETRPPLNDLADTSIWHFQKSTNIDYLENRALVPTIVRLGAPQDKDGNYPPITIGPENSIEVPLMNPMPAQPIYWLTPTVDVLTPSNQTLDRIEKQMGALGLAFLTPDLRRAETAAAKRIDASTQNASILSVARALQDCLETAFMFAGQYINEPAGSVTINTDFEEVVMDPTMIAQMLAARQSGNLSLDTFLYLLEKGKVLEDGFDIDAEKQRILTENANTLKSMDVGADPGGDGGTQP